jgi:hypothetical protein
LRYFSTDARTVQHTAMSGKVGQEITPQDFTRSQQPGSPALRGGTIGRLIPNAIDV